MARVAAWTALTAFLALALAANAAPHSSSSQLVNINANIARPVFVTDVPSAFTAASKQSPHDVAIRLATSLLGNAASQGQLRVRDDSYYDAAHGIYHVYLAQDVNGVNVYNGGLHAVVSEKGE